MPNMNTADNVIIDTRFGKIRGTCLDGIMAFNAVPYSKPRTGVNRFEKPSAPPCWDDIYDATSPGPVFPQLPSRLDAVMGAYEAAQSEDSLHINIWAPRDLEQPAPVLVFIHGGAFMTGGGSLPCYNGHELAKNTGMVVVTINYRLGLWGFMPIPEWGVVNLGHHDQIAALRWVRQAIGAFGGDASQVTVAGQSAGAYSIAVMLGTELGPSLFDQAILMSAPLGLPLKTAEESTTFRSALLRELGYPPDALEKLLEPSASTLLAALARMKPSGEVTGDVTPPFMPVIDGNIITCDPLKAIIAGSAAWCHTLVGITREEHFSFSVGDSPLNTLTDDQVAMLFEKQYGPTKGTAILKANRARRMPATPRNLLADMRSDVDFIDPTFQFVDSQVKHGQAQTYFYHFDWQSPQEGLGAGHCLDLPFLFGNLETWSSAPMLHHADPQVVRSLTLCFQQALSAFVHTGTPCGENTPHWPSYQKQCAVMHFDNRTTVFHHI